MNEIYNKYCLYLKYMCEVACAEQNIDFGSKFKELSSPAAKPTPRTVPKPVPEHNPEQASKPTPKPTPTAEPKPVSKADPQPKKEVKDEPTTRLSFDDGYYVGETKNGLMHGKGTRYWFDNEKKWEGDWVNGVACGHIVVSFGDLVIYDGQMENGLPNGEGTLLYPNTGERYVGHFVDYRRDGFGKLYTSEGLPVYEGEWKNDKQHGQGKSFLGGVCRYDGQWKDGKKSGKGTEFDAKGNVLFQGNWENGNKCK